MVAWPTCTKNLEWYLVVDELPQTIFFVIFSLRSLCMRTGCVLVKAKATRAREIPEVIFKQITKQYKMKLGILEMLKGFNLGLTMEERSEGYVGHLYYVTGKVGIIFTT